MSRLSLVQLEAVHWIAELGSFHAAAAHLNITQPTISFRVREIEKSLGRKIFARAGRGMRLTADGIALAHYARRALGVIGEMEERLRTGDPLRGTLRLGAADTFAMHCLAPVLGRLEARFPRLKVEVTVDNSSALSSLVDRYALDLAFLVNPEVGSGISVEALGCLHVAWVSSPALRPTGEVLVPAEAARLHVLTHPAPSTLDRLVREWFGSAGAQPERLSTCTNLPVMAHLAASSVGISVLPTCMLRRELSEGALVQHRHDPPFIPQVMCAAFPDAGLTPSIELVLATAKTVLAEIKLLEPPLPSRTGPWRVRCRWDSAERTG